MNIEFLVNVDDITSYRKLVDIGIDPVLHHVQCKLHSIEDVKGDPPAMS
jgi:hypothetical protein